METILVELSNKKQSTMLKELLRELKIYFIDVPGTEQDNLSGENFKQSLLKIREEYVQGKTEEFKEVKIENLWK